MGKAHLQGLLVENNTGKHMHAVVQQSCCCTWGYVYSIRPYHTHVCAQAVQDRAYVIGPTVHMYSEWARCHALHILNRALAVPEM